MQGHLDLNKGFGQTVGGVRNRIEACKRVENRLTESLLGQEQARTSFYNEGMYVRVVRVHCCCSKPPCMMMLLGCSLRCM